MQLSKSAVVSRSRSLIAEWGNFINFVRPKQNLMSLNHNISRPVITDPADWHLCAYLGADNLSAYLGNTSDPAEPVTEVLRSSLKNDGDSLLQQIENTVYDNPYILDDFSADIILSTQKFCFAPSELSSTPEASEHIFTSLYPEIRPDDIFCDTSDRYSCIYTSEPGLKDFIFRTFPGSRVSCEAMVLTDKFSNYPGGGQRVYLHCGDDLSYIIAFTGKNLIFSTSCRCTDDMDAVYYTLNAMQVYGLAPDATEIYVSGRKERRADLVRMLRGYVGYVMMATLPKAFDALPFPLSVSLVMSKFCNK